MKLGELRLTCIFFLQAVQHVGLFSRPGTEPVSPAGRVYLHGKASAVDVSDDAVVSDPRADILHDFL